MIVGVSLLFYQNAVRTPNVMLAMLSGVLLAVLALRLVKPGIFPDQRHKREAFPPEGSQNKQRAKRKADTKNSKRPGL